MTTYLRCAMAAACLSGFIAHSAVAADDSTAPQTGPLRAMLKITWKKGPNLPQGFQDSDGGFIGTTLITAGGFCQGKTVAGKTSVYPRGFLSKVWGLDIAHPEGGWSSLPDLPGPARQELFAAAVDDGLCFWGGISYTPPNCYAEGYRLARQDSKWIWDKLPSLPSPVCASGICAIKSNVYVLGGADYDSEHFYTAADRTGQNKRLGARFLSIDMHQLSAGWKQLPPCPGTPRWVAGMATIGGRIYVLGGATGDVPKVGYCSVVDNWVFDTATQKWSRLRDLPLSSGNFTSGAITYKERYVLLVGGAQYDKVMNPDGTIRDKYGQPSRFNDQGDYWNDVFVYDTKTGEFGSADKLPLNNNLPMTVVRGNHVYLIGGETGGSVVEGEAYAHHPELLLVGTIEEAK